jgi:A/G-specific adenine glycosylase
VSVKIVQKLSIWFRSEARDLPWRKNPEPYWVWLSEIMLQQTQVKTVLPYFARFIDAFPEVSDLALSDQDSVMKLWAGLGYYSRARNLHRGAQALHARMESGQGFPLNRDEWLEIPGVGEYTAGAICSIALQQREPIVDGNVVRVLSRIYKIKTLDAKKSEIWKRARDLVEIPNAKPRVLNQSLMELGALICKPKNPSCEICPVKQECGGRKNPDLYPEKKKKTVWKKIEEERWVLLRKHAGEWWVLLSKNGEQKWRVGLWDFPSSGSINAVKSGKLLHEFKLRYVVTNHKVERTHQVFQVKDLKSVDGMEWFRLEELPGVPSPTKKAIQSLKPKLARK